MYQSTDSASSASSYAEGASSMSKRSSVTSNNENNRGTQKELLKTLFHTKNTDLGDIFSENILAKVLQVAEQGLRVQGSLPTYPETVPQSGASRGRYEHRDADFWTCGFFPGSIYALLERAVKFPSHISAPKWYRKHVYTDLLNCGRHWSVALNNMAARTDTHDMGFIIQPALQRDWELTGNPQSLESVTKAAYALASRYDPAVGAIRSWDQAINHRYSITDMNENFLVIIDSMCNLDLLFYIGHVVQDEQLISIATTHADTVLRVLVRDDYSTFHLANLDPQNGKGSIKAQMTNQGYEDSSTWSRGQAWAIMGFAHTYLWTKNLRYLDTAIKCANLFLSHLGHAKHSYPFVPAWDFDAPQDDPANPLRDTSAGVIAANGMLLIHQALQSCPESSQVEGLRHPATGGTDFLGAALSIVQETLGSSLDRDYASLSPPPSPESSLGEKNYLHLHVNPSSFDAILRNATANNNEHAHKRYSDHGLVYADYFLLEFGNKLCRMGLC